MRMARSTGAFSGLLIALLGVWGALIPFVGPYFKYSFGMNTTWHFTTDRLWLNILPGALALLSGILLFIAARRPLGVLGGCLGILAGAWFVVGPAVSLTWESGPGPIGSPLYGSTRQMLELIGYFYGLGAVILTLAAFALGRFVSRPLLSDDALGVAGAPMTRSQAPAASDGGAARPRARFSRRARALAGARPESQNED